VSETTDLINEVEDFRSGVRRLGRAGRVEALAELAEVAGIELAALTGVGRSTAAPELVRACQALAGLGVAGRTTVARVLAGALRETGLAVA